MSSATQIVPEKVAGLPAHYLSLLVIAAERGTRESCKEIAEDMRFRVRLADNAVAALRMMESRAVDLVLLDSRLAGRDGVEFLVRIKQDHPETEVVVLTANPTVDSVLTAMKSGAYDCLRKPFLMDELRSLLERAADHLHFSLESRFAREALKNNGTCSALIGRSAEIEKLHRIIAKVAVARHPVLIQGESGTGKEAVARAIHFSGPFRDKPFIPVDCACLSPSLMESELFGSSKGSVGGVSKLKEGLFALANQGTIFLDEISALPLEVQAKLARALHDKETRPIGSAKTVPFGVRIIAASSRGLEPAMEQGAFRRDLHFCLNVVNLRLTPLRDRKEDIPMLAAYFLQRYSRNNETQLSLTPEALKLLHGYDWPGNVSEMESCLQRATALSSARVLDVRDLPEQIRHAKLFTMPSNGHSFSSGIMPLATLEKHAILAALRELNGDKLMVAASLGIGKTTLYRKLKEYGIAELPGARPSYAAGPAPRRGTL
jgi:DNA-binding NtrC family response regulator